MENFEELGWKSQRVVMETQANPGFQKCGMMTMMIKNTAECAVEMDQGYLVNSVLCVAEPLGGATQAL